QNKTRRVNLLPDNLFTTESQSSSKSDNGNHNLNLGFQVKIDSTATLWISPNFSKSLSKSRGSSSQRAVNEFGNLLNESQADNYIENDNFSFCNRIYFFKTFQKKSRSLNMSFDNSNTVSESDSYTNS